MIQIPIVPELLDRLQVILNAKEGVDDVILYAINDKVNDANSMLFAIGNFVGPIVGSAIYNGLNNNASKPGEIIFLFDVFVFTFIFIFNCGFSVFSENREFQKKLKALAADDSEDDDKKSSASRISKSLALSSKARHLASVKGQLDQMIFEKITANKSVVVGGGDYALKGTVISMVSKIKNKSIVKGNTYNYQSVKDANIKDDRSTSLNEDLDIRSSKFQGKLDNVV